MNKWHDFFQSFFWWYHVIFCAAIGCSFVGSSLLLDPVTFLLCDPTVATMFVYKDPTNAMDLLMHFFLSRYCTWPVCMSEWSGNRVSLIKGIIHRKRAFEAFFMVSQYIICGRLPQQVCGQNWFENRKDLLLMFPWFQWKDRRNIIASLITGKESFSIQNYSDYSFLFIDKRTQETAVEAYGKSYIDFVGCYR